MKAPLETRSAGTAAAFVAARRKGLSLADYPGERPRSLVEAYRIQDEAISLWDEPIGGWKVGRINPPWSAELGVDRLVGPIFQSQIIRAGGAMAEIPIFVGGFAAVEGEFVFIVAEDAPASKTDWSDADAEALIGAIHIGVEVASSPYFRINDEGPFVTISDFGNNAGLLIGPPLAQASLRDLAGIRIETHLDGALVGTGDASNFPGGVLESFKVALASCASRGRPLRAGQAISTGALSGVHQARAGQAAELRFGALGALSCSLVAARAATVEAV